MDPLKDRYAFLQEVIKQAGALAWDYYLQLDRLTKETKGLQDLVSNADREVEAFIIGKIKKEFPEDSSLGEETSYQQGKDASMCWVIDPIDGTLPFLFGIPQWCVSIGVVSKGEPVLGAVFEPQTQDLYHAMQGAGSFLNKKPLKADPRARLDQGMTGCGYSFRSPAESFTQFCFDLLKRGGMVYKSGSGALMICYAASGKLVAFAEAHINSWDAVAGYLVAKEAGYWTSPFTKGDWLVKGNPLLICPEHLKDEYLSILPWIKSTLS